MDFDDHDDPDEEMGGVHHMGGSSYDSTPPSTQPPASSQPPLPNSSSRPGADPIARRNPGGGSAGRYKECLKNHAVGIGGHAIDGCGEFMPAGEEGTLDALKCAACGCHRNFHRKDGSGAAQLGLVGIPPEAASAHHVPHFSPYYGSAAAAPGGYDLPSHHHHHHRALPPPPLALPSTSGGGGSRDEQEDVSNPDGGGGGRGPSSSGRKRFRTKFTGEQKDRMLAFAERVGWRIQKHDEAAVQQFCAEVGVKRHVLKVWMHNNKNTLGKKP